MEEGYEGERWIDYVDWRGKPALRRKHGGMIAASFVLVVEIMENLAFLANASNLVTYLDGFMYFSPARSATTVTNFMGTAFFLALLGGFLSDAFFTTYVIYLISALIEFFGLIILTIQARSNSLKPQPCGSAALSSCQEATGGKAAMLFIGLYLTALGVGGIKGSLPSHGAEQLDETTADGRRRRSTFFNYFVFCLSCGALIAVTFVVWVEDNKGWQWGFAISTLTVFLSIPTFLAGSRLYRNKIPNGSPLTVIAKVFVAAIFNSSSTQSQSNAVADLSASPISNNEVVKQTVQQAATMDTRVGGLTVPPASLPVFPVIFIMALAPLYDHVIIPLARKLTRTETGITHLQRIGIGLVLSIVAMAAAALVEVKRKKVAEHSGLVDSVEPLPISFFWVALQYLFLGSADLFTLAGLLEFFFTEAPAAMRSLATSLSWVSLAMGYYLSSVLVSIVNSATRHGGRQPWLAGSNLNHYHLERFYWLMCGLSAVNFGHYLFWAIRYKYRSKEERLTSERRNYG